MRLAVMDIEEVSGHSLQRQYEWRVPRPAAVYLLRPRDRLGCSPGHFLCILGRGMPINRLLKGSDLRMEEIDVLNRAFNQALKSLGLVDRNDPVTEIVVRKIIAVGKRGLSDPAQIANVAVAELQA
jgi:hypothetical protein